MKFIKDMYKDLQLMLSQMNKVEKYISAIGAAILIGIQLTTDSSFLAFVMGILGIIYVLSCKYQNKSGLLIGSIQVACYALLAYNNKVYGDMILNIYTCGTLVIGYFLWNRKPNKDNVIESKKLTKTQLPLLIVVIVCLYLGIYYGLTLLGGFKPYMDALNTTCSVSALILTVNKYRCTWWLWTANNIASLGLYIVLWMSGAEVLPVVVMFGIYTINSLHGIYLWNIK